MLFEQLYSPQDDRGTTQTNSNTTANSNTRKKTSMPKLQATYNFAQ